MNPEKELCELPEWVKLVNRVLYGPRKWEDEKRDFDRIDYAQGAQGGNLKKAGRNDNPLS